MIGTRLYAPSLVLFVWAAVISLIGRSDWLTMVGLVATGVTLLVAICELVRRNNRR